MPPDPASKLNRSAWQAGFTYTMVLDVVKIQDTGKGKKSVDDELEAVRRKIEKIGTKHRSRVTGSISRTQKALGTRWNGTAKKRESAPEDKRSVILQDENAIPVEVLLVPGQERNNRKPFCRLESAVP